MILTRCRDRVRRGRSSPRQGRGNSGQFYTDFIRERAHDRFDRGTGCFDRGAGAKWPGLRFIEEEANPILPAATLNARDLTRVLVHYRVPSLGRSIIELAMTVGPLVLLWAVMWATLHIGYWLCLLLAVPTAGFL